jgi:hypothetical protein
VFKRSVFLLFLISLAWGAIASQVMAELRDPTRPTGYAMPVQDDQAGAGGEAPLRLEAVFYSPTASGVLINGRRYHVGDMLRDARIESIGVDSVMLKTPQGEQVLSLSVPAVKQRHGDSPVKESKGKP